MSALFQWIGTLLTEGYSFIVSAYDFITTFILAFGTIVQYGYGISPLITIPAITFLPITFTIGIMKFILRKGK